MQGFFSIHVIYVLACPWELDIMQINALRATVMFVILVLLASALRPLPGHRVQARSPDRRARLLCLRSSAAMVNSCDHAKQLRQIASTVRSVALLCCAYVRPCHLLSRPGCALARC